MSKDAIQRHLTMSGHVGVVFQSSGFYNVFLDFVLGFASQFSNLVFLELTKDHTLRNDFHHRVNSVFPLLNK